MAACHLKLEEWKETAKAASESLNDLDQLDPTKKKKKDADKSEKGKGQDGEKVVEEPEEEEEEADEEIISAGATNAEDTSVAAKKKADIERIRSKALLRRARARSEMGGWSILAGAEEGMYDCQCWGDAVAKSE